MKLPPVSTGGSVVETAGNSASILDDLLSVQRDLKLSDKELAGRLGIGNPDLSKVINGSRLLPAEWLERDKEICLLVRGRQDLRLGLTPESKRQLRIDRIKFAMGLLVDEAAEVGA